MDWRQVSSLISKSPRPGQWRHAEVLAELDQLSRIASEATDALHFERTELGFSGEGRRVDLVRIGHGPTRVLGWTQMHGDEPTHTSALLSMLRMLIEHADTPPLDALLKRCTLWFVPLLNPDGAERYSRYNAVGVDVNRDARSTATAEGRLLKRAASLVDPQYAFNLHNQQHRRHAVGDPRPTRLAVLAPPANPDASDTPNSLIAKRLVGAIVEAAEPLCDGRVTRYAADYTPTAFGEWFQASGAATVLLESGGIQVEGSPSAEELQLFALFTGCRLIANGIPNETVSYESLQEPAEQLMFDLLVRGVRGVGPLVPEAASLDFGINYPERSAASPDAADGVFDEIGDLADRYGIEELVYHDESVIALPGRIGSATNLEHLPTAALELGFTRVSDAHDLPDIASPPPADPETWLLEAAAAGSSAGPIQCGTIQRGREADLVIAQLTPAGQIDRLRAVLVGGTLAWRDGKPTA